MSTEKLEKGSTDIVVGIEEDLELSPQEEKRLLRRIDWWFLPYATLYLLSYLDRGNIGQARLAGLEKDLHLTGSQYPIALSLGYVSYIVFEIPSNLVLKKFRPHRWICFTMTCWSLCQIGMGLVKNAAGLYAMRFLLGMFEAGLFPGIALLLSSWYTREELNWRVAIFFTGSTVAGAFSGILAFGIRQMAGVDHKNGWQWIFIIEGLVTLVCAIPAPWMIPDFPEDSSLLSPEERKKWIYRLNRSQGVTNAALPLTKKQVYDGLLDWRAYMYCFIDLGIVVPFFSLSLFVPTIIAALGFTNAQANLLSAAPFALGTITTLIVAWFSDWHGIRGPYLVGSMLLSCVGYIILLCDVSNNIKFLAVFLAVAGVCPGDATSITFVGNNFGPLYTRAVVLALVTTIGVCGGLVASNIYPAAEGPKYHKGHAISLAFSFLAIFSTVIISLYNKMQNQKRNKKYGKPDEKDCNPHYCDEPERKERLGLQNLTKYEILALGDRHPAFRYMP